MTTTHSNDMITSLCLLEQLDKDVLNFFKKVIPLYPELFEIPFRITYSKDPEYPGLVLFLEHIRDGEIFLIGFPLTAPLDTVFLLPLLEGTKGHRLKDLNLMNSTDKEVKKVLVDVICRIKEMRLTQQPRRRVRPS